MCIAAFAWRAHPRWLLIAAANRDEYHARPAASLARWPDADHVLAGRDLQSGGTWLGVSEQGRFALVTNVRGYGLPDVDRASRGALVSDLLTGAGRYANIGAADLTDFNPVNLIVVDGAGARFGSNRPEPVLQALDPGIHGLANGALDAPWPKTVQLKGALAAWLEGAADHPEQLLDSLALDVLTLLSNSALDPADGAATPIFIRNPLYGTRCSTIIAVNTEGSGLMIERRFDAAGIASGDTTLSFTWPI
jgi:uncharacterized protein with NRDE domain